MPIIETISLVATTAPMVAKFLLDTVNKIRERKPADNEIARLKGEVEALKNTLESKERKRESITERDVELVKEKFERAEALQRRHNLDELSDKAFRDWENRLRDEDRAIFAMNELETLIKKADELHISEDTRTNLEDIADHLDSSLKHLKEEKRELRLFSIRENRDAVEKRERTLKRGLRRAIELIGGLKAS